MNRRRRGDRALARCWAQELLARVDWVILDTETTGLDTGAEVIQIAVMSPDGIPLIDTLVRPSSPIPADATVVHGITDAMVAEVPAFVEVYPELKAILQNRTVISYNADYDARLLRQTARRYNQPELVVSWQCAMRWYAQYVGDWSDRHGGYTWQKLPRGAWYGKLNHQAIDDCRATLELLRTMAAG